MRKINTISEVVRSDLCISCGACSAYMPDAIKLTENNKGMLVPLIENAAIVDESGVISVCPGRGYNIREIGGRKFGDDLYSSYELGLYEQLGVGYSTTEKIMEKASSGGLMTSIAYYMIEQKIVDGVIVTKSVPGDGKKNGPRTKTYIAKSLEDLLDAQGSKYCPVPSLDVRELVESFNGLLAFVGTPCQIAGLELLKEQQHEWVKKIIFTIGNFCGGFRDFRETDKIIERAGFSPKQVEVFSYRGGGQPGRMHIQVGENIKELAYPDYAKATGFIKNKRCRYCVDATGELADISFGDAWINKYLKSENAWSIFIARSAAANQIINGMRTHKKIICEEISENEIIASQLGNITTKKYRQGARNSLAKLLGVKIPSFDVQDEGSRRAIIFELKVIITHKTFYFLELIGLYPIVSKILKRYPRDM